jgi:uncharacterized protein
MQVLRMQVLIESPFLLSFIVATFLLGGIVKGVIGLGLPTIAVGLLSVAMPPAQAVALLIVPSLVTNVGQAAGTHFGEIFRRLWTMMLGILVGTLATAGILTGESSGIAALALGGTLIIYAVYGLAGARLNVPPRHERWWSIAAGLATGLVTGATGIFVIPAVPYLQALGFDKDQLVQALGLSFLVSTVSLALALSTSGSIDLDMAGASFLALLPALAGMAVGRWVRSRISATVFRRCFFIGLLLLGAHLVLGNAGMI